MSLNYFTTLAIFISVVLLIISRINATLPGQTQYGILTFDDTIDNNAGNNCAWPNTRPAVDSSVFPFSKFTAVNSAFFRDALACGECYELRCTSKVDAWGKCACKPSTSMTVMVFDYGQDKNSYPFVFDFSMAADSTASAIISGGPCNDGSKYNIEFTQVCCDHLSNIQITNAYGMTAEWLGFIVSQVRGYGSIQEFWFRENGRTDYYQCQRDNNGMNYNFICDPWSDDYTAYLAAESPPMTEQAYQLPIDIKIVNTNGDILESLDLITGYAVDTVFDFGANYMSGGCSGGSGSGSTTIEPTAVTSSPTPSPSPSPAPIPRPTYPPTTKSPSSTTTPAPVSPVDYCEFLPLEYCLRDYCCDNVDNAGRCKPMNSRPPCVPVRPTHEQFCSILTDVDCQAKYCCETAVASATNSACVPVSDPSCQPNQDMLPDPARTSDAPRYTDFIINTTTFSLLFSLFYILFLL
jgi:hypothetical protein